MIAAAIPFIFFGLAQTEVPLWPNLPTAANANAKERYITHAEAAPGELPVVDSFHRVTNIHNPSITVFLPPKETSTGAAFVIAPGGGHKYLVVDLEGYDVAKRLNSMGIAAFVLKNRLARAPGSPYTVEGDSLADAQRAIQLVRSRATEWGVNPARVGIMGFSAGGELASLAETRYRFGDPNSADPVDRQSSRPDFAVLGYAGLKTAMPGVTSKTPPTFILVNHDDSPSIGSAEYYVALKKAGVPAELHIYSRGGHGFGVNGRTAEFPSLAVAKWPERLRDWMMDSGFLPR